MRVLIKNIAILLFFIFFLVFSNSSKSYAYDCYDSNNAGTVAPDNGTVCAGMYIVPNTVGGGSTKLKKAIHSGSNAYISHGGEQYWLGEESGKKKVFTGQVQNFQQVFYNKKNFNGDIGYWDMSRAVVTAEMFKGAKKFNQDIGDWNMSKNKWYWGMFYGAKIFNQDIGDWNTSKAVSFSTMFAHAHRFNQDISSWNTSKVFTMYQMFARTKKFNQNIGAWDTSDVEDFTGMFNRALDFNNGGSDTINNWNVSKAVKMRAMFFGAIDFNQPISNWSLKKSYTNSNLLRQFLQNASNYDKDLTCLDVSHFRNSIAPISFSNGSQLTSSQKPQWGQSVPASCTAAPTLSSSSPADNDLNISNTANIFLTFDENVNAGDGDIIIKKTTDNSIFETIAANSNLVTGTGTDVIEINPSNTFASGTEYYVVIDSDAFKDLTSNYYAGISSTTELSFTTLDSTDPNLTSSSPAHLNTGVAVDANIILNFSEAVDVESGNITIKKTSDDSTVEAIDVTSSQVTGSGTTQITINPSSSLDGSTEFYLIIDTTAFDDAAGNSYAGIDNTNSMLSFTTIDNTNPTLSSSTPTDNATGISTTANITLNFSEAVDVESGNITIKKTSDNSTLETIDVTDSAVTGTGTNQITINPSNTFASSTEYYILIDATAFDDAAGNSYAGISSTTALSFTSKDTVKPYLTSTVPAHLATDIATNANIVLNFSETVVAQSGGHYITIFNKSDDSEFEKIDVTNAKVSGSGTNQITINPTSNFVEKSIYYIKIDSTAFDDSSGNSYAGISTTNKYKFTIVDSTNPTLSTSSPTDDATDVNTLSSLVLTFDEAIDAETGGEVYLYKSDNTLVKTYSVTDTDYVNRSSSFAYNIDISAELEVSTSYYIKINASAFDDTAGNSYAGISDTTTLNFTTASTNCGCVAGQLVNKNDVVQSGATVQLLDLSNNLIDTTTTDDEGRYDLYPSTTGSYKVLYVKSTNKKWRAKNAHGKFNGRYVEEIDFTTNCEEYLNMDAILIDPAGVVYDSSTRAAISGATVRLFFNGALVNNDWLDSATGTNTEITGSDGQYNFVLNGNASSGDYVLEVEPPSGYIFESSNIPAETSTYIPGFGAGVETIQDQDTAPTTSEETNYYLTFAFTIAALASDTSNGVIHNHIPVDSISNSSQELVNKAKAPLTKVLKQDFHDTVSGQTNLFNDIARQSLSRLGDQIDQCGDIHSDISLDKIKLLQALEQEMLDGDYSSEMKDCNSNRSFYTDVQFKVTTSRYVGTQHLIQLNQTQEFKIRDERLRGIFYGGYLSNSDVTAAADGTIEGRGVHLGFYETTQYQELNYNFYLAASHGKHDFDFDILDGFTPDRIKTKGDYGYYAGYTGASVSGEVKMKDTTLTPRLSIDSAYAESDKVNVDFTAKQKNIEQSGNLMLDQLNGSKVTTELVFHHPTNLRDWELIAEITPRFFCQQAVGEIKETCGIGNKLLFQGLNNKYGNFDMGIDLESVDGIQRQSYMFAHIITIFENLSISSSYSFDESMQASFDMGFEYSIDY